MSEEQPDLNAAAEKYLDWIREGAGVKVRHEVVNGRHEIRVSHGAHKQWFSFGATFVDAVRDLRFMMGD